MSEQRLFTGKNIAIMALSLAVVVLVVVMAIVDSKRVEAENLFDDQVEVTGYTIESVNLILDGEFRRGADKLDKATELQYDIAERAE